MTNLNIRIDDKLKADAEAVLYDLGLTASEAVRIFFSQIRNTQSIPFELKLGDYPSLKTREAIKEAEADLAAGKLKSFSSVKDLMAFLDEE